MRIDQRKIGGAGAVQNSPAGGGRGVAQQQKVLNWQITQAYGRDEIAALVLEHADTMNSINCATALHRLAKGGSIDATAVNVDQQLEELLSALTARVLEQESDVTPRSLTSIAWAVGKLRLSDAALLAALAAQAAAALERDTLDAFGIANVAWALATLHSATSSASSETVTIPSAHTELCTALADAACSRPASFKPQEITNLLWAFASLRRRHARLFEVFAEAAAPRMGALACRLSCLPHRHPNSRRLHMHTHLTSRVGRTATPTPDGYTCTPSLPLVPASRLRRRVHTAGPLADLVGVLEARPVQACPHHRRSRRRAAARQHVRRAVARHAVVVAGQPGGVHVHAHWHARAHRLHSSGNVRAQAPPPELMAFPTPTPSCASPLPPPRLASPGALLAVPCSRSRVYDSAAGCQRQVEHRGLLAAVCEAASRRPHAFDAASASQLLWALSRLTDGVDVAAVSLVAERLREVRAHPLPWPARPLPSAASLSVGAALRRPAPPCAALRCPRPLPHRPATTRTSA